MNASTHLRLNAYTRYDIMEAEQVVEKILADAKAEADKITKEAQEKEAAEQAKLTEQLDE